VSGDLAAFFKKAADEAAKWGAILGNFTAGLIAILVGANTQSGRLVTNLQQVSEKFRAWATTNTGKIDEFFKRFMDIDWKSIGKAIANIGASLGSIALGLGGMSFSPLMTLLKLVGDNRIAAQLLVLPRVERAQRAGDDQQRDARPQPHIASLHRGHDRSDGSAERTGEHRSGVSE